MQALVYNHDVLVNPPKEETVTLALEGLQVRKAEIVRIDEDHANAYPEWVKMGSPDYPSDSQIHTLIGVSALHAEPLETDGSRVTFALPPDGVALIKLY